MDLTDDETEMLRAMRAVTIDDQGAEVFVGLDGEESVEFLAMSRRHEAGEDMIALPRFLLLRERHEAARQEIVEGRAPLDPSSNLREGT